MGIVFSVGRVIRKKNTSEDWGGKENRGNHIGSPDSKGESDLCMFVCVFF